MVHWSFIFQAEGCLGYWTVTGVETCALPIAARARDLRAPLEPGRASAAPRMAVRRRIPPLAGDRYLKADLDAARALAEEGRSEERRVGKECRSRWSPDH